MKNIRIEKALKELDLLADKLADSENWEAGKLDLYSLAMDIRRAHSIIEMYNNNDLKSIDLADRLEQHLKRTL